MIAGGFGDDVASDVNVGGPGDAEGKLLAGFVWCGEEGFACEAVDAVERGCVVHACGEVAIGGESSGGAQGVADDLWAAGVAVGGGEDEGVGGVFCDVECDCHGVVGAVESLEKAGGVVGIAEVVAALFFDDEEEAVFALCEDGGSDAGHLGEGGCGGLIEWFVCGGEDFLWQVMEGVVVGEDAEEPGGFCGVYGQQFVAVVNDGVAVVFGLLDEVAFVFAGTGAMAAFDTLGEEVALAAGEDDIHAGADNLCCDGICVGAGGALCGECGCAWLADVTAVDEAGGFAMGYGFVENGAVKTAEGGNFFGAIHAEGVGDHLDSVGMGCGASVGGGYEAVFQVAGVG